MNILITGGSGFGGSGITKRLLEKGHKVTVLDTTGPLEADKLSDVINHPNLSYKWKSLHDITPYDIAGHDVVVHLAAQADVPMGFPSPRWTCWQNVDAAVCLLEACRQTNLDRIIYAGSGNEWGRPVYVPIDEKHPLTPHNPYSFSKAAAELAFWAWYRAYNLPIVIMSNGIVTGPGMRRQIFIFKWLWEMMHSLSPVLEGGDQTRDVTYVDDVMDAWMLAIEAPREKVVGEKFQVSFGEEHTVSEILEWCKEEADFRGEVIKKPHRPGEKGQRECFDNSKARNILGYSPRVGSREAVCLTAKWIRRLIGAEGKVFLNERGSKCISS